MSELSRLGHHLKSTRASTDLSQKKLAERAGVSSRTIYELENGVTGDVQVDSLIRLATAMEKDPRSWLEEAGKQAGKEDLPQPVIDRNVNKVHRKMRQLERAGTGVANRSSVADQYDTVSPEELFQTIGNEYLDEPALACVCYTSPAGGGGNTYLRNAIPKMIEKNLWLMMCIPYPISLWRDLYARDLDGLGRHFQLVFKGVEDTAEAYAAHLTGKDAALLDRLKIFVPDSTDPVGEGPPDSLPPVPGLPIKTRPMLLEHLDPTEAQLWTWANFPHDYQEDIMVRVDDNPSDAANYDVDFAECWREYFKPIRSAWKAMIRDQEQDFDFVKAVEDNSAWKSVDFWNS